MSTNKNRIWISVLGAVVLLILAINDLIKFGPTITTITTFVLCAFFIYEVYQGIRHPERVAAHDQQRKRKAHKR